ncbi:MAG TPA: C69 family dipeptidase [Nocardioidaceae bacterium]|nr:C69 family dipeptidase [Nocardioidaceae bacterium]
MAASGAALGYTLGDEAPVGTAASADAGSSANARQVAAGSSAAAKAPAPSKSYGLYVGKNLTKSGDTLLAGSGEEVSSHWLEIIPRAKHGPDETIEVGVTEEATIPGKLIEIPQVRRTFKYITMNYSDFAGFPTPLTNGGLNEKGVAIRDIWSPSRTELIERTPTPQTGPQYSDLARIALERARSARHAVRIIGRLIDRYGYSTYGGNSHLIADKNEGWVMIQAAGGEGIWAAERLGPDEVRVSYPGYIGEMPDDYQRSRDFMGSDNLFSFAEKQGWYDPDSGEPFNFHEVYGDQSLELRSGAKYLSQAELEEELLDLAPDVTVADMMTIIGDKRFVDDESGYGQVVRLRDDLPHPDLATLWVAPTGSITAPFIPWRMGVQDVPPEYGQHRYLTKEAASTFLDTKYQDQEATEFAGRTFKRLMYHTCAHPEKFLPEVTEALDAFEHEELQARQSVETTAMTLYDAGEERLARQYLTEQSFERAEAGLELGNALLGSIEARAKLLYGISEPPADDDINAESEETVNCLVGADPDVPPEDQ